MSRVTVNRWQRHDLHSLPHVDRRPGLRHQQERHDELSKMGASQSPAGEAGNEFRFRLSTTSRKNRLHAAAATIAPINWLMMYSTASGGDRRPVDRKPIVRAGLCKPPLMPPKQLSRPPTPSHARRDLPAPRR
jgi:hypothetical protein